MNNFLREAAECLRAAGIESPRAETRILWEHAKHVAGANSFHPSLEGGSKREALRGGGNKGATNPFPKNSLLRSNFSTVPQGEGEIQETFQELLQRRLRREPIAYIIGHKEFWSLNFEVGPGALIPRPETETVIEQALGALPDRNGRYRVLDLGTGTACLLIAVLKGYPHATGVGIDSADAALQWARRNIVHHKLESRCTLLHGTWEAAIGSFDLIVSNPPYIPSRDLAGLEPDVRDYEPVAALDGGPDGLAACRELAPVLKRQLTSKGVALLEIGAGQAHMAGEIIRAAGLEVSCIVPDLAGIPRCVVIRSS